MTNADEVANEFVDRTVNAQRRSGPNEVKPSLGLIATPLGSAPPT